MILGLEHCVTTKTDGNQEVEWVANHDMNSDSVVSVFLWRSDNIASKIGFGHLNHSWQTRSVADWLPREPAPLAEVVDDNNVAVKKTIVVSSSQRPVKTIVVSSSQRHGNIALHASCGMPQGLVPLASRLYAMAIPKPDLAGNAT